MGVQLGGLFEAKKITLEDLSGKSIAFDGNNVLYQFLTIIRGRRGEPLRDNEGRITSHLSGLFYRNSNLLEMGVKIVYVFDGSPNQFKRITLQKRKEVRMKAKKEYEKAVKEGDVLKAKRYGQQSITATMNNIEEAINLLQLMGIPCVQSPGEGEAQAAYMAAKGDVWGSASQDFDSLLYGTPRHIRNLSITGRRKLPRKNVYIKIEPEIIELFKLKKDLNLSQEQLIDMGILLGTDYNPDGIKGIGPKTAFKLIQKHGNLNNILEHINNFEFPIPVEKIKELFLKPRITDNYELKWSQPDTNGLLAFLCGEHNFNHQRVLKTINKMKKGLKSSATKRTLDSFFG
jgi:flap endonuclease-1